MDEQTHDLSQAKKVFSRIGLAFSAILLVTTVLQVLWFLVPNAILGENNKLTASSWWTWLGTMVPMYLVAVPLGLLILRKLPARTPEDHKLSGKFLLEILPMCFCLMYGGNLVGTFLSMILSGGAAQNTVAELAMDTSPLKVICMVILAPLLEEYICRKQIIDRTRQYGEKISVFLSALVFGLLHQNLFQFFYAFALGLIFGFVYIRSGRLRYSILLHGFINFMGGVVAPWVLSKVNMEAIENLDPSASTAEIMAWYEEILPGVGLLMVYATILLGLAITGLVLLIKRRKSFYWAEADQQLPREAAAKTVYLNVGMVLYVLLCIASIILALL